MMRPSVNVRCSVNECGELSQPASTSFGTTYFVQVSASFMLYIRRTKVLSKYRDCCPRIALYFSIDTKYKFRRHFTTVFSNRRDMQKGSADTYIRKSLEKYSS